MGFREFVTEDFDAVISQIRRIRDQMHVIRMKRLLAKEKDSLSNLSMMILAFASDMHE